MSTAMELDGLDPLAIDSSSADGHKLLNEANRRIINNILKSYTGYFDIFSELIQNALDATEAKLNEVSDGSYQPRIWIDIDIEGSTVKVIDNGVGLPMEQFRYFLKPNVSFKKPKEYRGQKGVGATFLAYGFSLLRVHSRHNHSTVGAILRQGRQWAQDANDSIPRPVFEVEPFNVPELGSASGTSVQVALSGLAGERPKRFDWIGARSAEQWLNILRIKTPLGGIYLETPKFAPTVSITVRDSNGSVTSVETSQPEYFYPHEIPDIKIASIGDIEKALAAIPGSPEDKRARLDGAYKRLDALWEIYGTDDILSPTGPFQNSNLTEEHRALIEKHRVVVYSAFLRSAKMWNDLNENVFKLNPGQRVIHGGLQLASDYMVQGDPTIIPLTSTIGYQANSHVIVHFTDGNPDMGRKVFQPELKQLADILAVRCVTVFKRYLELLKPDTGATVITPDKELHEWKRAQENYRDKKPVSLKVGNGAISLLSKPQQEQDVIALYHQLIGLGALKGLHFFATSMSDRYDSLYQLDYNSVEAFAYSSANPLGVTSALGFPRSSEPRVLEYKYEFDDLVNDISNEVKFAKHINLVVCWRAGKKYKEKYYLNSLLVGDEGTNREVFGATHQAFAAGNQQPDFELCILEDLLGYLTSPADEVARQRVTYSD